MSVELVLVRHGNTFGPGDRIVWVGKGEDLPLVPSGRAQAKALGDSLLAAGWTPTAIFSGGLKRQVEHLALAAPPGSPEAVRLEALDEVDYGDWGGLTTEEIVERFGAEEMIAWNERSVWPGGARWPETEAEVRGRVQSFLDDVSVGAFGERVLVCSSNGLLRWFLDAVPGALERARQEGTFKVKTGGVGRMVFEPAAAVPGWTVTHWNCPPSEFRP
ncbi:Phosphoserine phosphatase 1 [Planctomycetes bacterium Poly30]|uniref:Phosphoserine phosphatase 1 n=1 Tax=Saltatorellus ferox TaxID=2528018 RepID=A0A518EXF6_9BACT|nr:Phosphoserine phosphatase 1 [Planctomycetes bacterium Poly30]